MDALKKRLYESASVQQVEGGYTVHLDTRAIKTPAKTAFVLPSEALAQLVADEWNAQDEQVQPDTMPATRMANSAIDKVAHNRAAIIDMLLDYGGSDLLCYRATAPEGLQARQGELWTPYLDWAQSEFGVSLRITEGIMPVAQPDANREKFATPILALSDFQLTAFHDFVVITGSLVLALALLGRHDDVNAIWAASRLDDIWQAEQWGEDEEASKAAARKKADLEAAIAFLDAT